MKHALVIFNPVSGAKKWKNVRRILQETLRAKDYEWTWHETQVKEDLRPLFRANYDRVFAVGGDGTVAKVVRHLIEEQNPAPLVIIPQGSGNLLARALGLPLLQIRKALELGLTKEGQKLDVMRVNQKYYGVIAVGRGYDAFLMQQTPRALKRQWGLFAYGLAFLKTFLFYRSQPYKLTLDGKRIQILAKLVMVFNIMPVPLTSVRPDDGLLNLFTLSSRGKVHTHSAKKIVIKAKNEFKFQIDGELLKGKVVSIEVLPKALNIVAKRTKSLEIFSF